MMIKNQVLTVSKHSSKTVTDWIVNPYDDPIYSIICCCSVARSCLTLCDPMNCSTASLPFTVSQGLLKLMSIESVLPSKHPILYSPLLLLSSILILSQHQGLLQRVSSSHQATKALELQVQHQPFQWILRTDLLEDLLVWSPCSPRDFQESSTTPQFKSINSSSLSLLYSPTLTSTHDYWKNHSLD